VDISWDTTEDRARYELIVDLLRVLDDFAEDYQDRESIMKFLRRREDQLFSLRGSVSMREKCTDCGRDLGTDEELNDDNARNSDQLCFSEVLYDDDEDPLCIRILVGNLETKLREAHDALKRLCIDANRMRERPRQGTYDDDLHASVLHARAVLMSHGAGGD
jgi:hypothetical protein